MSKQEERPPERALREFAESPVTLADIGVSSTRSFQIQWFQFIEPVLKLESHTRPILEAQGEAIYEQSQSRSSSARILLERGLGFEENAEGLSMRSTNSGA